VRIVTIRRLDYGETAESFTNKLFENVSHKEAQANQTLLVIDSQQRHRIRTTKKSLMPDDIAQSVVSETILVPLREGDKYNQAFLDASDRLVAVLSGKPDPGPPQIAETANLEGTFKKAEETDTGNATIWVIGLYLPLPLFQWQLTTCMSSEFILILNVLCPVIVSARTNSRPR